MYIEHFIFHLIAGIAAASSYSVRQLSKTFFVLQCNNSLADYCTAQTVPGACGKTTQAGVKAVCPELTSHAWQQ